MPPSIAMFVLEVVIRALLKRSPRPGLRFGFRSVAFHTTQSHHHGDQLEHPSTPAICATLP